MFEIFSIQKNSVVESWKDEEENFSLEKCRLVVKKEEDNFSLGKVCRWLCVKFEKQKFVFSTGPLQHCFDSSNLNHFYHKRKPFLLQNIFTQLWPTKNFKHFSNTTLFKNQHSLCFNQSTCSATD